MATLTVTNFQGCHLNTMFLNKNFYSEYGNTDRYQFSGLPFEYNIFCHNKPFGNYGKLDHYQFSGMLDLTLTVTNFQGCHLNLIFFGKTVFQHKWQT